jgi:hypothetical protein
MILNVEIEKMIRLSAVRTGRVPGRVGIYVDDFPDKQGDKRFTLEKTESGLAFVEREMYSIDSVPPIVLPIEGAQALMDSLWDCGIRPTEGSGSAGSFAAQGAHLADMQRLVFDYVTAKRGENVKVD